MRTRRSIFRTDDHQELWRPPPAFMGPIMPPMLLWLARGRPKSAWELKAAARVEAAPVELGQQLELFGGRGVKRAGRSLSRFACWRWGGPDGGRGGPDGGAGRVAQK